MIEIILSPFIFLLSLIVPKNKKQICFGSWFGKKYSDNSKLLFESFLKESSYTSAWIVKDKNLYLELKSEGIPVYYYISFIGLVYQLRSKSFVCTVNSRDFLFGTITPRNIVFQLWHGSPLKKIGFDVKVNFFKSLLLIVRSLTTDHISFVFSPALIFDSIYMSAFNVKKGQVIRSGYPRCDELFSEEKKGEYNRYKVAYLPTHRNEGHSAVVLEKVYKELLAVSERLDTEGIDLIFKPHFYDHSFFINKTGTKNITIDLSSNTYHLLSGVDMLITDYSSIFFDFDITSKPILFFAPDLDIYKKKSRELYFSYDEIVGNYVDSVDDLVNGIVKIKNNIKTESCVSFSCFNECKTSDNSLRVKLIISKILDEIQ